MDCWCLYAFVNNYEASSNPIAMYLVGPLIALLIASSLTPTVSMKWMTLNIPQAPLAKIGNFPIHCEHFNLINPIGNT